MSESELNWKQLFGRSCEASCNLFGPFCWRSPIARYLICLTNSWSNMNLTWRSTWFAISYLIQSLRNPANRSWIRFGTCTQPCE